MTGPDYLVSLVRGVMKWAGQGDGVHDSPKTRMFLHDGNLEPECDETSPKMDDLERQQRWQRSGRDTKTNHNTNVRRRKPLTTSFEAALHRSPCLMFGLRFFRRSAPSWIRGEFPDGTSRHFSRGRPCSPLRVRPKRGGFFQLPAGKLNARHYGEH